MTLPRQCLVYQHGWAAVRRRPDVSEEPAVFIPPFSVESEPHQAAGQHPPVGFGGLLGVALRSGLQLRGVYAQVADPFQGAVQPDDNGVAVDHPLYGGRDAVRRRRPFSGLLGQRMSDAGPAQEEGGQQARSGQSERRGAQTANAGAHEPSAPCEAASDSSPLCGRLRPAGRARANRATVTAASTQEPAYSHRIG